jgi:hypothetical protein
MKCIICKNTIKPDFNGWAGGHNAEPIKEGKCCGICNDTIVIPTRLRRHIAHNYEG